MRGKTGLPRAVDTGLCERRPEERPPRDHPGQEEFFQEMGVLVEEAQETRGVTSQYGEHLFEKVGIFPDGPEEDRVHESMTTTAPGKCERVAVSLEGTGEGVGVPLDAFEGETTGRFEQARRTARGDQVMSPTS
jgi:hypothetical protein